MYFDPRRLKPLLEGQVGPDLQPQPVPEMPQLPQLAPIQQQPNSFGQISQLGGKRLMRLLLKPKAKTPGVKYVGDGLGDDG